VKRVLILCTGNSCRSQMAEALWRSLGNRSWESTSAGSNPAGYVHPLAIRAMRELGIDISKNVSKSLDAFKGLPFDLVVTVCDNAKESCLVFPGAAAMLHWPFDDPAKATGSDDEKMVEFRRVRDEIQTKIKNWMKREGVTE
jgi:arsenate reductase (thioredoxin)